MHIDQSRLHTGEHLTQGGHVVDVLQAFARGFQQQGEILVGARRREQLRRPQTLLPQWHAFAGVGARHEQRACRTLAEPCGEQHAARDLRFDDALDVVGVERDERRDVDTAVAVWQTDEDAVIRRIDLPVNGIALQQPGVDRERPWLVHAPAEWRVHDDAPVAFLVAAAFDHHMRGVGHHAGGGALLGQQPCQVVDGVGVEAILDKAGLHGIREARAGGVRGIGVRLAGAHKPLRHVVHPLALRQTETVIAAVAVAMPKRQARAAPGGRQHDHTVVGDLLDLPGCGAQGDDVTDARFIHHLLVEFADAPRARTGLPFGKHHRVEAAVGNRAATGHREALRPLAGGEHAGFLLEHEWGPERGELLTVIGAGDHAHHGVEHVALQRAVRGGTAHGAEPCIGADRLEARGGHRLLREHIEWAVGHTQRLDGAGEHAFDARGGADDLFARHRVDECMRHPAHAVVGSSHALQAGRHRQRRRQLDDQIHRTHVDAEFQTACGHDAFEFAHFELLLDLLAPVFRHGAVMRHRDGVLRRHRADEFRRRSDERPIMRRLVRQVGAFALPLQVEVVELGREPFGESTRVHENERRAVCKHLIKHAALDQWPDRGGGFGAGSDRRRRPTPGSGCAPTSMGGRRWRCGCRAIGFTGLALRQPLHCRRDAGDRAGRLRCMGLCGVRLAGTVAHAACRLHDLEVECRQAARLGDGDRPAATEERRGFIHRVHGGGKSDALWRCLKPVVEPFQAQREVGPALGAGHGMHFVEDHRLHGVEHGAGLRCEHQVQRFRRRHQDVRRPADDCTPFLRRGIAAAHGDRDLGHGQAHARIFLTDAVERRFEVFRDIHAQRLER